MFDSSRREIVKRITYLEREVKNAEDLQVNFKNFKGSYSLSLDLKSRYVYIKRPIKKNYGVKCLNLRKN